MINKENIIKTNNLFGGKIHNKSNLDYEIDVANKQKNIFRSLAHIVRGMTTSHSFTDGNKRTALVVVKSELADIGIRCDQRKLAKSLVKLAKNREGRINIIERRLRKSCQKHM